MPDSYQRRPPPPPPRRGLSSAAGRASFTVTERPRISARFISLIAVTASAALGISTNAKPWAFRLPIGDDFHFGNGSVLAERLAYIVLGGGMR